MGGGTHRGSRWGMGDGPWRTKRARVAGWIRELGRRDRSRRAAPGAVLPAGRPCLVFIIFCREFVMKSGQKARATTLYPEFLRRDGLFSRPARIFKLCRRNTGGGTPGPGRDAMEGATASPHCHGGGTSWGDSTSWGTGHRAGRDIMRDGTPWKGGRYEGCWDTMGEVGDQRETGRHAMAMGHGK